MSRSDQLHTSIPDHNHPSTVAFLCGSPLGVGGVETHIRSLICRGDKEHYRFMVIASASDEFAEEIRALGGEVLPWVSRHRFDWKAVLHLYHLLKARHIDLLHIQDPRGGLAGRFVAKYLGIPVIYTVHLSSHNYQKNWLMQRLYLLVEAILNRYFTDHIFFVSKRAYEEAIETGLSPVDRSHYIPNGIDLDLNRKPRMSEIRQRFETPQAATVICFVGRLTPQKGVDLLLEALYQIKTSGIPFRCWLLGDGPSRADLENQAKRMGLSSLVQFLGFSKEVSQILAASDIFALPSRFEAAPITILEAMAVGKPCVVTDVGDSSYIVHHQVEGLVTPPNDARSLALALTCLLKDTELRYSMEEKAKLRAKEFDIKTTTSQIQSIYARTLNL